MAKSKENNQAWRQRRQISSEISIERNVRGINKRIKNNNMWHNIMAYGSGMSIRNNGEKEKI